MGANNQRETREQRFNLLYRETRNEIMAYLVRRAHSTEDAADALSETYAAAWRKLDSLPEGERARLWLYGAARNELRMAARKEHADDELIAELSKGLQAAYREQTETAQAYESLEQAISGMSDVDREILTLTAWEDLTPREIAAVMGLSANVVRVRLHRVRRELQTRLEHQSRLQAQAVPVTTHGSR